MVDRYNMYYIIKFIFDINIDESELVVRFFGFLIYRRRRGGGRVDVVAIVVSSFMVLLFLPSSNTTGGVVSLSSSSCSVQFLMSLLFRPHPDDSAGDATIVGGGEDNECNID